MVSRSCRHAVAGRQLADMLSASSAAGNSCVPQTTCPSSRSLPTACRQERGITDNEASADYPVGQGEEVIAMSVNVMCVWVVVYFQSLNALYLFAAEVFIARDGYKALFCDGEAREGLLVHPGAAGVGVGAKGEALSLAGVPERDAHPSPESPSEVEGDAGGVFLLGDAAQHLPDAYAVVEWGGVEQSCGGGVAAVARVSPVAFVGRQPRVAVRLAVYVLAVRGGCAGAGVLAEPRLVSLVEERPARGVAPVEVERELLV